MDCTNKNCPAYAKCLAPYRGSRCKATRATYGLGDPITNADRVRTMSDEELANLVTDDMCELLCGAPLVCEGQCKQKMLEWLQKEVQDD